MTEPPDTFHPPSQVKQLHLILRQPDPAHFDIATTFLENGPDIDALYEVEDKAPRAKNGMRLSGGHRTSRDQVTALYDAARRNDYEAVQFLIKRGADARLRNWTGMGLSGGLFPIQSAVYTLCGLDAMRLSKERKIISMAEELFGTETEEEYVHRCDAFDDLEGYFPRHPKLGLFKPDLDQVQAVVSDKDDPEAPKERVVMIHDDQPSKQKQSRYNLRPRKDKVEEGSELPWLVWTDPRSGLRWSFHNDRMAPY